MTQLIAVVATAVILNGERTTIQPGQPLPELSEHDARALKGSGAAFDPQLDAEARDKVEAAALTAAGEFQAQRERALAEAASIADPDPVAVADANAGTVQPPPAARTANKKR